jgi:hypothetical protein
MTDRYTNNSTTTTTNNNNNANNTTNNNTATTNISLNWLLVAHLDHAVASILLLPGGAIIYKEVLQLTIL